MMTSTTRTSVNVGASNTQTDQTPPNSTVFHDFLSSKPAAFRGPEPPASASAASGAARPHFSSTSDLGSERQMASQVERISCCGPRNDHSVGEIPNQSTRRKRSISESTFMGSSREGFHQTIPESSHMMKMLHSSSGGERLRASHYDICLHGAPQTRPVSSFMLQPTTGANPNLAKLERQYKTCIGQSSLPYQMASSRFRDGSSGPLVLSQLAADEGSRTGNKGSGILDSVNASNVMYERNTSALLASSGKPASHNADPESSNLLSRSGVASVGRQMTIIYAGQVHVFDDIHPNKADVIMALAGSSGVSPSTNLPKLSTMATRNDNNLPGGANETSNVGDPSFTQKYQKLLSVGGNPGSSNQGTLGQAAESSLEPKHEV